MQHHSCQHTRKGYPVAAFMLGHPEFAMQQKETNPGSLAPRTLLMSTEISLQAPIGLLEQGRLKAACNLQDVRGAKILYRSKTDCRISQASVVELTSLAL
jgi:hypothetical protein